MIMKNKIQVNFRSKYLSEATGLILGLGINLRGDELKKLAVCLRKIRNSEIYREDFSSIEEYASKVFNYSKSSVNRLLRVADNYLQRDKGRSIFIYKNGKDFNLSQLNEFLVLPKSEIIKLVESGKIHPDMTVEDIRYTIGAKMMMDNPVNFMIRHGMF